MIECADFYNILIQKDISFFTGVPDSLLKDICGYINDHTSDNQHMIAPNEGGAIALAAGYHLSTGKVPLVYLQNSGLGNTVNPLVSLADPEVYGIPMLLMIGWRGQPGTHDEPQHVKQGKITQTLIETLGIDCQIIPESPDKLEECIDRLLTISINKCTPAALIVPKGIFGTYKVKKEINDASCLTREDAIKKIVSMLDAQDIVVSTTGKTSRELYEFRETVDKGHSRDFLNVGSMGHASLIAAGIAINKKELQVFCLDGDGAALMHLGAFAAIGTLKLPNFKHIILNNGVHDSVGGQPTAGRNVSFDNIALHCGYRSAFTADTEESIIERISELKKAEGPALLEIKIKEGSRKDLGRPKESLADLKKAFMDFIK